MAIYHSVTELIGHTPLVELTGYEKKHSVPAEIVAKVELFNPAGSIKDRIAAAMLEDAEEKGILNKDTVIIEPTSGNTGVALAAFAAARGYRIIITMPETMSVERRRLMAAYGAELVLTSGPKMVDAIAKANELAKEIPNSFIPGQFTNPANPKKHYDTTGPEIWNDAGGCKATTPAQASAPAAPCPALASISRRKTRISRSSALNPRIPPYSPKAIPASTRFRALAQALSQILCTPPFTTRSSP